MHTVPYKPRTLWSVTLFQEINPDKHCFLEGQKGTAEG